MHTCHRLVHAHQLLSEDIEMQVARVERIENIVNPPESGLVKKDCKAALSKTDFNLLPSGFQLLEKEEERVRKGGSCGADCRQTDRDRQTGRQTDRQAEWEGACVFLVLMSEAELPQLKHVRAPTKPKMLLHSQSVCL